jgi:hypothetical protein
MMFVASDLPTTQEEAITIIVMDDTNTLKEEQNSHRTDYYEITPACHTAGVNRGTTPGH